MREIFIEDINYGGHGTTIKFSMTPFNVWHVIPGSRRMGGAKRPRKILFPAQYETSEIVSRLKKLVVMDKTIKDNLEFAHLVPFKTVIYRNKRLKQSALLPIKAEARDFVEEYVV